MASSSLVRLGMKATGTLLVGGVGGTGSYLYVTDDGMKRSVQAYRTFAPVIIQYRLLEYKHKYFSSISNSSSDAQKEQVEEQQEQEWEALDEQYAKVTVEKLGQLQGMYSKYGQTAAGLTNTLGDAWIRELRTLENEIPPRSSDVVRRTIEEETGRKLEETFATFDPIPLGSASIGQVHRATLRRGSTSTTGEGEEVVAVKVQYPEAQLLFTNDIHAIRLLCEWFAPEQLCTLDALEQQNEAELDYLNEAQNLIDVRTNMIRHGFSPSEVVVPQPNTELTTKRMLVMELLPGVKLIDGMRAYYSEYAKKQGTTLKRLETKMRRKLDKEGIPDKYEGPSATKLATYQKLLYIRDGFLNVFVIGLYNVCVAPTMKLFSSKKNKNKSSIDNTNNNNDNTNNNDVDDGKMKYLHTSIPPNTPRIVDTLMRVHGYQLLVDGLFNADP